MKIKKLCYISFALFALSIFLPWFTFNFKIMGYCWGFQFLKWLVVPQIIIIVYMLHEQRKILKVLSELSLISVFATYMIAFGKWQEVCNIAPGFQWKEGFYTATVGYWISLLLFIVFSVVMQFLVFNKSS